MSDSGGLTRPDYRRAKILLFCAGAFLLSLVALRVAFLIQCTEVRTSATYRGIVFSGNDRVLSWASSPQDALASCELLLRFPGHKAVSIHDVTEEYIQKNFSIIDSAYRDMPYGEPFFSRHLDDDKEEYRGFGAYFVFTKGRLTAVTLQPYENGVSCSNRIDGTFIQLPISHKDLAKAWGKPDQSERKRVKRFRPAE